MAHGKVLRSRYAHARIKRIDTTAAERLEGVLAVVTGKEVPEGYFGVDIKDQLVFARDKVRYLGMRSPLWLPPLKKSQPELLISLR